MANLFTSIPEKEPVTFYKGETVVWTRKDLTDYPVGSYAMSWSARLESNGGTSLITIFIGLGVIQSIRVSRNV